MQLPNAENAVVEIEKLPDYCHDPDHEIGGHKARVFASSLGFAQKDALLLRNLLLQAARTNDCRPGKANKFGKMFIVEFDVTNLGKTATIRSAWIIDTGEDYLRLVSCYVI